MHLDHVTIVTTDLAGTRQFFVEIAGLDEGARPPFGVEGFWLYAEGRPVIHLVDSTLAATAAVPARQGRVSPRIDHFALRVAHADEWHALVARLAAGGIRYQTAEVPLSGERQIFVPLAAGIVIEFVTSL